MTQKRNQKQNIKIDIKSLESEAQTAISKEAYQQLDNTNDYRIGVSVILSVDGEFSHLIELVYCVLKSKAKVDISLLNRAMEISKVLQNKGYSVYHQDDGWIICEKVIEPEMIEDEYEFFKKFCKRFRGL